MPDPRDSDFVEQVQLTLGDLLIPPVLPAVEEKPPEEPNPAPPPQLEIDDKSSPPENSSETNYESLLQEKDSGGIEILVQMAQRKEFDPKNIDIIDITDRFLQAIAAAPRENLRQSGKIIFHASVLLRLKAEALLITKIEDLDVGGDDFLDFDLEGSPIIYDSNDEAVGRQITLADLQRALVRRSRQKAQGRQRRVTLEQLIESLREAEQLEKKRIERKQREPKAVIAMDGYHDMEDMDDILDLAHDEDIEDVIARIEQMLVKKFEAMLRLSLGQLLGMLEGKGDWVDAFLAVLFLSNSGKLNLEQEVFYGPLYLVRYQKESLEATGTDGVAAGAGATTEPVAESGNHEPVPFKKPERQKRAANSVKRERKKKTPQPDPEQEIEPEAKPEDEPAISEPLTLSELPTQNVEPEEFKQEEFTQEESSTHVIES